MKNILKITLLAFVIFACEKEEDPIFTGDVRLSTKEELKEFGSKHIKEINGSLLLGVEDSSDEVSNLLTLSALSSLQKVSGDLRIINTGLVDLYGLDNLTYIGGDLQISNTTLQNLNGLENLAFFEGALTISKNNNLVDITSLSVLTSIQSLSIISCYSIAKLPFENIVTIPGDLILKRHLKDITGLKNLTYVGGNVDIWDNIYLIDMQGLNKLVTVEGDLRIHSCHNLESLKNLPNLVSVGGDLYIDGNPFFRTIEGLTNLKKIGGNLHISNCINLLALSGLIVLEEIGGIYIYHNSQLNKLDALSGIKDIQYFSIRSNNDLSSLEGLESLKSIDSYFIIDQNSSLLNMNGLSNLQNIKAQSITITRNDALFDFCGLQKGLENTPETVDLSIYGNTYNPTREDILKGDCAQ